MPRALSTLLLMAVALIAVASTAAAESPSDGYLYGTVTTHGGSRYTGLLRWGDEETFWDDLFHSAKEELPYRHLGQPVEDPDPEEAWWEVFGRKLNIKFGERISTRIFMARFGDIQRIEVTGSRSAKLIMKSGVVVAVSGYANDVGGKVSVRDPALGEVDVEWQRIDTIEFAPAPAGVVPPGARLYGAVTTPSGIFEGFVQWDKQECLSTDRLDGKAEDGSMSVPMGSIRSIERRSRSSSAVTLTDGRELLLSGTNDVNDDNRGILVEDTRFGRVEVPWSAFERLELRQPPSSGRGYAAFPTPAPLEGTVTDRQGNRLTGRLVFDLDESETWEMLNGSAYDVSYSIPFGMVAAIVPHGDSAEVTLRNGQELRLEEAQDVSASNAGVAILKDGAAPTVVRWSEIERIELEE